LNELRLQWNPTAAMNADFQLNWLLLQRTDWKACHEETPAAESLDQTHRTPLIFDPSTSEKGKHALALVFMHITQLNLPVPLVKLPMQRAVFLCPCSRQRWPTPAWRNQNFSTK